MHGARNLKQMGTYLWLISGIFICAVSAIALIEGLLSGHAVFSSTKYGLSFFGVQALVMYASMVGFGLLAIFLGWYGLRRNSTRAAFEAPSKDSDAA